MTSLSGGALRGNPAVAAAADVLASCSRWLARQVAEVTSAAVPAGPQQVTLSLRDGKTVVVGERRATPPQKNRELSVLLPRPGALLRRQRPGHRGHQVSPRGRMPIAACH